MAAVAPKRTPTWQEILEAEVLNEVFENDPLANCEKVTEKVVQDMVAWCITVLGKQPEYLLTIAPLNPEKISKLYNQAVLFSIQQVAQKKLQFLRRFAELEKVQETIDQVLAERQGKSLSTETADSKEQVEEFTEEEFQIIQTIPSASSKMALLKRWIEKPTLLFPEVTTDLNIPK